MVSIFVLVVLSLLAASLINVVSDSSRTVAVEVYGTRALMAAQSGADLALVSLFPLTNGAGAGCDAVPNSDNSRFEGQPGLNGCSASVTCGEQLLPGGGADVLYTITSTGFCQAGTGQETIRVERVIELEARGVSL
ncbi:MSHA biogenesis protein MshP [Neiella marina]|uniref:MSHA biogenesis protein MshP n=1 Tax=Neiella holothuriorum TaxID=2870530 RepID=A0ABS7EAT2_9GAMM|nr:MSHA biogenesis protein MshP [Neiella holothuriorum]MBW8189448.1 MSHA biogenesis protein MshP [Neiella holothuriorum]